MHAPRPVGLTTLILALLWAVGAQVATTAPGDGDGRADDDGATTTEAVAVHGKVLLVTSADLAEAWAAFAEWKTRQGKRTTIVTVDEITKTYADVEGDTQDRIKACIQEHINDHGARWIILGGDSQPDGTGHIPDRDTYHYLGRSLQYADLPTDAWYVSPDTWDGNGDGVYGNWQDDLESISYTNEPGACIARIPVRTADEVTAFTDKVIAYESAYPTEDFAKKLLFTCPEPHAYFKADLLWDDNVSKVWDGDFARYFKDTHDLLPDDWIDLINDGAASKIHMHGHGLREGWVLDRNKLARADAVAKLTNADKPLVMTTVSCFTGQFDSRQDPSIVESILRHEGGGAVAVVTPSREGVPIYHPRDRNNRQTVQDGTTRLLTLFWVHGLGGGLTTGEALQAAKADMAADAEEFAGFHWCLSEINLLGDPTLDMRAADAFTPDVDAPESIRRSARSIKVKTGVAGLTVCVWQGDVYEIAITDDDGNATLELRGLVAGDLLLTVCGANANTVARTVIVK